MGMSRPWSQWRSYPRGGWGAGRILIGSRPSMIFFNFLAKKLCNTQVRITLEIEASCEPYFEGDVSLTSFSSFTFLEIQDFGNHRWRVANFVVVDISCGL